MPIVAFFFVHVYCVTEKAVVTGSLSHPCTCNFSCCGSFCNVMVQWTCDCRLNASSFPLRQTNVN
jgi:hypothetical protein